MDKKLFGILFRYSILIIVAIPNLFLFYLIFTPLTVYLSYLFSKLLFEAILIGDTIIIESRLVEIGAPCIAGAAYYLLLLLNLSTPKLGLKTRLKLIFFTFGSFLVLNLVRIIFLIFILINHPGIFDWSHEFLWYFGSTLFVTVIWFFYSRRFQLKYIPIYSDLRTLKHLTF